MKNIKRILACILSAIAMLGAICIFAGCVDDNVEDKYNLNVMIVKKDESGALTGEKWFVETNKTDGHTRFSIEQKYDGIKYKYYVCAYNMPNHPEFGDIWFRYDKRSFVSFTQNYFTKKIDGMIHEPFYSIGEKGEYDMNIFIAETELWDEHKIELKVNIV